VGIAVNLRLISLAATAEGRVRRWERRLSPWGETVRSFRADGFYERFPAKGQVGRVARIHTELARATEIEPAVRGGRRKAMCER
jgi:hypothetical protein